MLSRCMKVLDSTRFVSHLAGLFACVSLLTVGGLAGKVPQSAMVVVTLAWVAGAAVLGMTIHRFFRR